MTPTAMPAPSAIGRLTIRAMTAAARARNSRFGPSDCVVTKPRVGLSRTTVRHASAPLSDHASVDIRPANTPAIRAASGLAAAARIDSPYLLYLRKSTRARTTTGLTSSMPT